MIRRGLLMCALLLMPAVLAACGAEQAGAPAAEGTGANGTGADAPAADTQEVLDLPVGSASTGSGAYVGIGAFAEYVNTQSGAEGFTLTHQATGGNIENLRLLINDELELSYTNLSPLYQAQNGTGAYEGEDPEPYRDILLLTPFWHSPQHWVTYDPEIQTIHDLAGRTVNIGPPGSGPSNMAEQTLTAAGIWNEVEITRESADEGARLLQDGLIDAFIWGSPPPIPAITEAAAQGDLHFITIPQDVIDYSVENYPGVTEVVIPAGDAGYGPDLPSEDLPMPSWSAYFAAMEDTPDHVVQGLMEILTDPEAHEWLIDQWAGFSLAMGEDNFEPGFDGIESIGARLHPVAAQYWEEEMGVEVPDSIK